MTIGDYLSDSVKTKRAREWAKQNGFEGRPGGWIYRVTETGDYAHCQGWVAFYERHAARIEKDRALPDPTQVACPEGHGDTHHLVPRAGVPTCAYCGKTRTELVKGE